MCFVKKENILAQPDEPGELEEFAEFVDINYYDYAAVGSAVSQDFAGDDEFDEFETEFSVHGLIAEEVVEITEEENGG